jgi:crotonobetainyl-CoA:carnitine CoA-transferase CaiB-like acyl-CoA transferase
VSAYFSSVNWGKEHLRLNLKDPGERGRFDALLRTADVLITNHLAADAEKLGLAHGRLRALNPRLVHGHIKGFAAQPERPAFDVVLQAETGYISMTGSDADHLAKLPIALIDVLAAHQLKEGLLLALLRRAATGQGALVEVSLEEAALSGLVNQASNRLMAGAVARPLGTLHPNIAPYGEVFRCADGGRSAPPWGCRTSRPRSASGATPCAWSIAGRWPPRWRQASSGPIAMTCCGGSSRQACPPERCAPSMR